MAIKLGMEAALKYKVGGQGGAGAWTALGNTRDVTLNLEAGEADVTTRANNGLRAKAGPLGANRSCEVRWDRRREAEAARLDPREAERGVAMGAGLGGEDEALVGAGQRLLIGRVHGRSP